MPDTRHPQSDPARASTPIRPSSRVGDDYYIATSTFEWYPGVQIHHSRDLVHWRLRHAAAEPREPAEHAWRSAIPAASGRRA